MNLSGLGAFAQGLAGGINQGASNYATLAIAGEKLEQEKIKTASEEARAKADDAYKAQKQALEQDKHDMDIWKSIPTPEGKVQYASDMASSTEDEAKRTLWTQRASGSQEEGIFTDKILDGMRKSLDITNPVQRNASLQSYANAYMAQYGKMNPVALQYLRGDAGKAYMTLQKAQETLVQELTEKGSVKDEDKAKAMQDMQDSIGIIAGSGEKDLIDSMQNNLTEFNKALAEKKKSEEPYKIGHIREGVIEGDKTVNKEYMGNGQWKTIPGEGGARYKPTSAGSELDAENEKMTLINKATNIAGKKMKAKYGPDAFFANTITGDTFMNPNYGDANKRQAILKEWEDETQKLLPKNMRNQEVTQPPTAPTAPVPTPKQADDVPARFKSDTSMKGNRLGKKTEQGYEVYMGNKLIGYYK